MSHELSLRARVICLHPGPLVSLGLVISEGLSSGAPIRILFLVAQYLPLYLKSGQVQLIYTSSPLNALTRALEIIFLFEDLLRVF